MPLIRFEPFGELERLFEGMPSLSPEKLVGFTPAVDVYETKDSVIVETPLAGVDPKDVKIAVEDNTLTLRGETKKESEVEEKNYYRKEIRQGSFYRAVSLPVPVVANRAEATSENGLLKVSIPKAGEAKTKEIKVQVKEKKAKVKASKKKK